MILENFLLLIKDRFSIFKKNHDRIFDTVNLYFEENDFTAERFYEFKLKTI